MGLIDEGRYTDEELGLRQTPLSGVFSVENAGQSWETLQRAVDRMVAIIQGDPHKERIDRIITRWLKRHLQRVAPEARVDLAALSSLVEDRDMLAENLENLVKKERMEGRQEGRQEGVEGTLRKLITLKFGEIPEWADARLEQASDGELDSWVAKILTADSLDELFKRG